MAHLYSTGSPLLQPLMERFHTALPSPETSAWLTYQRGYSRMPLMKKRASHLRLTLVQKLITGYAAMTIFTMAALISSIMGLYSLNKTAREIVNTDLTFIDTVNKLRDSIVAQERYASKFAILKSPEFIGLFQNRQNEFQDILTSFAKSHHLQERKALVVIYDRFRGAVNELFAGNTSSIKQIQDT